VGCCLASGLAVHNQIKRAELIGWEAKVKGKL
jgi:hypothetical protein